MIEYKEISWWYWTVTSLLLIAGLAGKFAAFPVQVRVAYAGLLLVSWSPPKQWLFRVPAIGTQPLVPFATACWPAVIACCFGTGASS